MSVVTGLGSLADPRRKGWLYVLLHEVIEDCLTATGPPTVDEHWADRCLATRGFGAWSMSTDRSTSPAGRGLDTLVWTLSRQLMLVGDAARKEGAELDIERLLEAQISILEMTTGRLASEEELRKRCRAVEVVLKELALRSEHPLLDSPYHRLLVYTESRLIMRLAEAYFRGTLDEAVRVRLLGTAAVVRLGIVEAVQGLALSDGVLEEAERRLIRELIGLGRFTREEVSALEEGMDELPTVERLAEQIAGPTERRLVLRIVIEASLIDHDRSPHEDEYVDRLAEAFGVPPQEIARLHIEAAANLALTPDLGSRLSRIAALERMNRSGGRHIERVITTQMNALVSEARRTGEIAPLLLKKANEGLTDEENERLQRALKDLARAVPALAIFAAPGGAILLPILERMLPFSLLPGSFRSQDEAKDGS